MSITASYRKDVARHGGPFGQRDGHWIAAASAVSHASLAEARNRERQLRRAGVMAIRAVGAAEMRRLAMLEWGREAASPFESIYLLVTSIERAGAFELAEAIATAALMLTGAGGLERGRLIALRARISRKRGLSDFAHDQYRVVWQLGVQNGDAELKARASLGLATLAQRNGNYPSMAVFARRAARFAARAGLRRIEHEAHRGLLVEAAKRRRFDEAIAEAWEVLRCGVGDPVLTTLDRQSLGQLFFEVGDFNGAIKLFVSVLRAAPHAQVVLAALGGLALAAAQTREQKILDWTLAQVDALRASALLPQYELASTLLECAQAAFIAGRDSVADRFRADALRVARAHDFHEFVIRAEALSPGVPKLRAELPDELGPRAKKVIRSVEVMKATPLPRRIQIGVATVEA